MKVNAEMLLMKGDKVKIDYQNLTRGNKKRLDWILSHESDDIFTIVKDSKFKKSKLIFALKEDENKPKWLFCRNELIFIKRGLKGKLYDLLHLYSIRKG